MLEISSTKKLLDNIRYESNPQNSDFYELPFMVVKGWLVDDHYIV